LFTKQLCHRPKMPRTTLPGAPPPTQHGGAVAARALAKQSDLLEVGEVAALHAEFAGRAAKWMSGKEKRRALRHSERLQNHKERATKTAAPRPLANRTNGQEPPAAPAAAGATAELAAARRTINELRTELSRQRTLLARAAPALLRAVERKELDLAGWLVEAGVGHDARNERTGERALHVASKGGHTALVKALLAAGAEPDAAAADGGTPLLAAIAMARTQAVKTLLAAGADASAANQKGVAPLLCSIEHGRTQVTQRLLAAGADVGAADQDGRTPLLAACDHYLAEQGLKVARKLVDAGADVNAARTDDGTTPLLRAIERENAEIARLLIAAGADPNKADGQGETPLLRAAQNDTSDEWCGIAAELIAAGADVDAGRGEDGLTPLLHAVQVGNAALVGLLLKAGVDVGKADKQGAAPLRIALENDRTAIACQLVEAGADANAMLDEVQTTTALVWACNSPCVALVQALLKAGADVHASTKEGVTALITASFESSADIVKMLLAAGADIDAANRKGSTSLMMASSNGDEHIVHILLEAGARVDLVHSSGQTALVKACAKGHEAVARALVEAWEAAWERGCGPVDGEAQTCLKAAIEHRHEGCAQAVLPLVPPEALPAALLQAIAEGDRCRGITKLLLDAGGAVNVAAMTPSAVAPLACAIQYRCTETAQMLLEHGANVDAVDSDGNTALLLATKARHRESVEVLLAAGASMSSVGQDGRTALKIARQSGDRGIAALLLERGPPPEEGDGEVCVICLMQVPSDGHDTTPCGHHFHHQCIGRWTLEKPSCPMCKAALPGYGMRTAYGEDVEDEEDAEAWVGEEEDEEDEEEDYGPEPPLREEEYTEEDDEDDY